MKKQLVCYIVGMTFAGLSLTACDKVNTTINVNINSGDSKEETVQMANPVVNIEEDAEYEKELGIKWDTSYLPGEVSKSIINNKIAQAVFEVENVNGDTVEITLRGTKDNDLAANPITALAGIYATELEAVNSIDITTNDETIVFNRTRDDSDDIDISYFDYEGVSYTITDDGDLSQMELAEIYDSVMVAIGAETINEPKASEGKIIRPLPMTLSLGDLEGEYHASINGIKMDDDGNLIGDFSIYTMDLYDVVDMTTLQPGDTIIVREEEVLVESVEEGEPVDLSYEDDNSELDGLHAVIEVNGGLNMGGCEFVAYEGGTYRYFGYDDYATYSNQGEVTLPIAEDAIITDHSRDFDGEEPNEDGIAIKSNDFKEYYDEELEKYSGTNYFYELNTYITIEDGHVVEITRIYTP